MKSRFPRFASASLRLGTCMAIAAASIVCLVSPSFAAPLNVTILGSGSPAPSNVRFSQSTLIEAGKDKFLFDLGRGVTVRLGQLGVPFKDITASFITHFHSDHLVGLPDLWLTGWLPTHEVADIDAQLLKDYPRFKEITAHHTSPEEAGRIFAMAKPKVAAFTHIIVLKANQGLDVPATEVVSRTRSTYRGPLALGEDLMRFEIGDTVEVFNARKERMDVNAP